MILVDANLLLYAKIADYPQHERAHTWLDERLNGTAPVGLPWHSLLAFMRIATNPRVFATPLAIEQAWEQVQQWLSLAAVWIPQPTEEHAERLGQIIDAVRPSSQLVADAHLAALAIDHGLLLCTTDNDFARFRDLRWENPLRT